MAEVKKIEKTIKVGDRTIKVTGFIKAEDFNEIFDSLPEEKRVTFKDGSRLIIIEQQDLDGNTYNQLYYMPKSETMVHGREVSEATRDGDTYTFDLGGYTAELTAEDAEHFDKVDAMVADSYLADAEVEVREVEKVVTFHMYKSSAVLAKVDASGAPTADPMMWEIDTIKGKTKLGGKTEKSTIIAIARPDAPEQACFVLIKGKTRAEVQAEIDAGGLKDFAAVQAFGGVIIDHPIEKIVGSNAKYAALTYFPYTEVVGGKIDKTHHILPWKWNKNNKIRTVKCPDATIGNTAAAFGDMSLQFTRIGQNARLKVNYHTALMKSGKFTFQYVTTRAAIGIFGLGALAGVTTPFIVNAVQNKNAADSAITKADDTEKENQMLLSIYANPEHDEAYTYGGDQVVDGSKGAAVHNIDGQYYITDMLSFNNLQVYTQSGTTYTEGGKEVTVENTPELKAKAEEIYNYTLDTEEGAGYATGVAVANVCYGKVDGLARLVGGELEFDYTMVDNYLAGEKEYITNYGAVVEEAHQGYRDGITANFEKGTTGGDSVTTDDVDQNSDEALTTATTLTGDPDGIAYIIPSDYDNVIYALDTPKEDLYEITLYGDYFGQTEYEEAIKNGEITDQFALATTQLGITAPKLVEAYENIYTSTFKQDDVADYRLAGHTTNVFLTEDKAYKFVGEIYATNANGMQNYELDIKRLSTASGIDNANATMNLNIPTMSFYNVGDYTHIDSTVVAPEEERSH